MRSLYSGIVALSNVFDNKTLFFFFSCDNATVIIHKTIFFLLEMQTEVFKMKTI